MTGETLKSAKSQLDGCRYWVFGLLAVFGALARAATPGDLNAAGLSYFQAGDYPGAVRSFREAVNQQPLNPRLRQNLVNALNSWAVRLGAQGDFRTALVRLDEARRLDPDQPALRANLAVMRINFGTSEIAQGRFESAERLLAEVYETAGPQEIAEADNRRASLYLLWAQEQRRDGQTAQALASLSKSLQLEPDSVPALLEFGNLYYRQGNSQEALAYYQEALERDSKVEGLAALVDKIARELKVEGDFEKRSNRYFTVSYENQVNNENARQVLDILWHAYREIGRELDVFPSDKLPVVLYQRTQYNDVTFAPEWSGALFDGKIRVPLPVGSLSDPQLRQLRRTLYHEYTHALLMDLDAGAVLPAWLNEGLACTFELDRDARRRQNDEDRRLLAQLLREGRLPSVRDLPPLFTALRDPKEAEQAYRVSRNFVGWLIGRYRTADLRTLVRKIAEGENVEAALQDVYAKSLQELQQAWNNDLAR